MDDSSDFTFCQVAPSGNDDVLESPKLIVDVGNVSLEETRPGPVTTKTNNLDGGGGKLKGVDDGPLPLNSLEKKSDEQSGVGSVKSLEVPQPALRRPPRSKVPFEKGFSQMDWLKVTRTHPDLAGLKGKSNRRLIPMEEVRQHKTEASAWTILKGRVYNISPYMKFHPGGADMLLKAAGKDGTSLFNKYHAWVNAEFLLEKCLVGILDESS